MRLPILFGLLAVSLGAVAEKLIVVVYTTDARSYVYRCKDDMLSPYADRTLVMRTDDRPGRVQWHAVGGVPPYKVLNNEIASSGQVMVTIMDATGRVGTGLGFIGRQVIEVAVKCNSGCPQEPAVQFTAARRSASRDHCADAGRSAPRITGPVRDPSPRTAAHVSDRGTRGSGDPTRVITSKPERRDSPGPSRNVPAARSTR